MNNGLPSTPREWQREVGKLENSESPLGTALSDFAQHQLGSASKMTYQHWLLLRTLCPRLEARSTHDDLFGSDGDALMRESNKRLERQPWWEALQEENQEPLDWGYMALWKQSVNDIETRVETLKLMRQEPETIYDDTDPFNIVIEPRIPENRPRRAARDRTTIEIGEQRKREEQVDAFLCNKRSASAGSGSTAADSNSGSAADSSNSGSAADSGTGHLVARNRPDEALVNLSLVMLLQGLALSLKSERKKCRDYNWTIMHKTFAVTQPGLAGERLPLLTAKTDGCLQVVAKGELAERSETLAILEVKPYRRYCKGNSSLTKSVLMQEGAEMAAWISTEWTQGRLPSQGDKKHRRVLISQDFDEVYITIAEFDDLYIDYIRGKGTQWPLNAQLTPSRAPRSEAVRDSSPVSSRDERGARIRDTGRERSREAGSLSSKFKGLNLGAKSAPESRMSRSSASQAGSAYKRTTPSPPTSTTPPAPGAPSRPGRAAATTEPFDGTKGFLVMRQFEGFKVTEPKRVKELAVLLMSLTRELCETDALGRFRG